MNTHLGFCLALQRANASLQLRLDNELGLYHGIAFNDFALLHSLAQADAGWLGMAQLARLLALPQSAVLRQLILLEKIGLVLREGAAGDRQAVLRPAGRALLNTAAETAERICSEVLQSITPAAVAMVSQILEKLAHAPSEAHSKAT